jgi:hypothetical protein
MDDPSLFRWICTKRVSMTVVEAFVKGRSGEASFHEILTTI